MTNAMKLIGWLVLPGLLSACAGSFSPSEQVEQDGEGVESVVEFDAEVQKVERSMKLYVYEGGVASEEDPKAEGPRKGYFVEFALNSDAARDEKPATVKYKD